MRLNQAVKEQLLSVKRLYKEPQKPTVRRKVNKKKNARTLRVYADYSKAFIGVAAIIAVAILWLLGYPERLYTESLHKLDKAVTSLGFKVDEVIVQGRSNTHHQDLMKILQIKRGDSIFAIDPQQVRFRLEKLEWIRHATVIRRLPDIIQIKIEERQPIAIWQHQGQFNLVDIDGTAIITKNYKHYGVLPLVIGEGAPQKSPEILKTLASYPMVQKNLQALSRVRERRWNLHLVGGILVKLSDNAINQGLSVLEKLLLEHRLSVGHVLEVDLRSPERYFLKVTPETIKTINANRKGKPA
ncbi:MAG: cell division protein FtsQ/DivIB [Pseudomonadota bacterium]|jgi:cell division protein FtsQ|nr:FtsQ-type POTRA domain-containing protein [Alphaproteobacteria bacterium]